MSIGRRGPRGARPGVLAALLLATLGVLPAAGVADSPREPAVPRDLAALLARSRQTPLVVHVRSGSCAGCTAMAPAMAELAAAATAPWQVLRLDGQQRHAALARQLGVVGCPDTRLYVDGVFLGQQRGAPRSWSAAAPIRAWATGLLDWQRTVVTPSASGAVLVFGATGMRGYHRRFEADLAALRRELAPLPMLLRLDEQYPSLPEHPVRRWPSLRYYQGGVLRGSWDAPAKPAGDTPVATEFSRAVVLAWVRGVQSASATAPQGRP
jgi:hypothetical protein